MTLGAGVVIVSAMAITLTEGEQFVSTEAELEIDNSEATVEAVRIIIPRATSARNVAKNTVTLTGLPVEPSTRPSMSEDPAPVLLPAQPPMKRFPMICVFGAATNESQPLPDDGICDFTFYDGLYAYPEDTLKSLTFRAAVEHVLSHARKHTITQYGLSFAYENRYDVARDMETKTGRSKIKELWIRKIRHYGFISIHFMGHYDTTGFRAAIDLLAVLRTILQGKRTREEEASYLAIGFYVEPAYIVDVLASIDSITAVSAFGSDQIAKKAVKILTHYKVYSHELVWFPARLGEAIDGIPNPHKRLTPERENSHAAPAHGCGTGDGDAAGEDLLTTFNEITNHYKLGRRTLPTPHKELSRGQEIVPRLIQTDTSVASHVLSRVGVVSRPSGRGHRRHPQTPQTAHARARELACRPGASGPSLPGPLHPDWCGTGDGDAAGEDPLTTFNEITNHYKLGIRTLPTPHKELSTGQEIAPRIIQTDTFPPPASMASFMPPLITSRGAAPAYKSTHRSIELTRPLSTTTTALKMLESLKDSASALAVSVGLFGRRYKPAYTDPVSSSMTDGFLPGKPCTAYDGDYLIPYTYFCDDRTYQQNLRLDDDDWSISSFDKDGKWTVVFDTEFSIAGKLCLGKEAHMDMEYGVAAYGLEYADHSNDCRSLSTDRAYSRTKVVAALVRFFEGRPREDNMQGCRNVQAT
ncbi:hypothetical protein HPB50_014126 [Hyalomma asiaticum]|uniref:Uncharacterized protein n=1 Tax=Hyalomma asiaticum TaxID=266040 RepID=A0ACB7T867_HYAAI|nr:hypothetical protein HPB50_014126 [Hyalomma asiaticum]